MAYSGRIRQATKESGTKSDSVTSLSDAAPFDCYCLQFKLYLPFYRVFQVICMITSRYISEQLETRPRYRHGDHGIQFCLYYLYILWEHTIL